MAHTTYSSLLRSEGKFIYFTMNSIPAPPAPPSNPPTTSPIGTPTIAPTTGAPTTPPPPPTVSPVTAAQQILGSVTNNDNNDNTTTSTAENDTTVTMEPTTSPVANATTVFDRSMTLTSDNGLERQREHQHPTEDRSSRQLQTTDEDETSGRFIILSHPLNGQLIYEFDSKSEVSIQKHNFAPAGIARRPAYGNYDGGEDNTHDVLLWGSLRDRDNIQGETMLFQLPKDFDDFDNAPSLDIRSQFEVHVLESVAWSTRTRPTFSESGMDVYFAVSANRFTGWNNGELIGIHILLSIPLLK